MGHYDEQYEAHYAKAREERKERITKDARALAEKHNVSLLPLRSTFPGPRGVCQTCAKLVYALPNWGCLKERCPHKPGD